MRIKIYLILLFSIHLVFGQYSNKLEYSIYSDTIQSNHIHKDIAGLLFNFVKEKINFIQFDDYNNCDLRAHLVSVILEKKFHNLKLGKMWLFADSKRASRKYFYKDNNCSNLAIKTKGVNWGYHVAPCIIIGNDTLVIDPSTQNTAAPISRWANDLIPLDAKGFLILKNIKYFSFPMDDDDKFIDYNQNWVIDDDILYQEEDYVQLAEKLTLAYFGFIEHHQLKYYSNKIQELCEE